MLVRLHMSRDPSCVGPKERASAALRMLQEERIRHAPVVEDDELVGIVTDRDLLRALPTTIGQAERARELDPLVSQVMSKKPVTVGPNEHVEDAALLLLQQRIHCLPVVKDGRLIGILTDSDLFDVFARFLSRSTGPRLTLLRAPGSETQNGFDLAREAVDCRLEVQSLIQAELPEGGTVTEICFADSSEGLERFLDRAGREGYSCLDSRLGARSVA